MKKLKQLLLILVLSLSLTSPAVIPAMGTTTVSAATVRKPSLSNSKVTARGVGKTIIFAKTGNYTLRCQITVKKKVASRPQVQSSVWIPATGKKYHRIPNCGNMNPNRAHKVTLSQAKQRGYTACKNCYR